MNPDVPTIKECGIDFAFPAQPLVFLAPKGTPTDVCEAFNKILDEINSDEAYIKDVREKLNSAGYNTHNVADSIALAQKYADTLAPYVK